MRTHLGGDSVVDDERLRRTYGIEAFLEDEFHQRVHFASCGLSIRDWWLLARSNRSTRNSLTTVDGQEATLRLPELFCNESDKIVPLSLVSIAAISSIVLSGTIDYLVQICAVFASRFSVTKAADINVTHVCIAEDDLASDEADSGVLDRDGERLASSISSLLSGVNRASKFKKLSLNISIPMPALPTLKLVAALHSNHMLEMISIDSIDEDNENKVLRAALLLCGWECESVVGISQVGRAHRILKRNFRAAATLGEVLRLIATIPDFLQTRRSLCKHIGHNGVQLGMMLLVEVIGRAARLCHVLPHKANDVRLDSSFTHNIRYDRRPLESLIYALYDTIFIDCDPVTVLQEIQNFTSPHYAFENFGHVSPENVRGYCACRGDVANESVLRKIARMCVHACAGIGQDSDLDDLVRYLIDLIDGDRQDVGSPEALAEDDITEIACILDVAKSPKEVLDFLKEKFECERCDV